ncbi:hypothetical protein GCM10022403_082190 [Streptomyces coacervatus]|uniref:Uncharacterized protein n=1 Tax=Streptomyces coacervatus TaxID=647381 RepID=A0ABP7J8U7_9ACTN
MIAIEAGPEDAGSLVAGALLAGSLMPGALVVPGGGALVVTEALGGGALLVTGALTGGELIVVDGEPGGALDGGDLELGGALDVGAEDDGPGPLLDGEDGETGDDVGDDDDDDGGAVDGPEVEGTGGVLAPSDVPPATLSVTYSPNPSSRPAGGSDAVTRAPSGGLVRPSYPTASPSSASSRRASLKLLPASRGTAWCLLALKVLSCAPVVPTGRSMPTAGLSTSIRASRCISRAAGCTATTEER